AIPNFPAGKLLTPPPAGAIKLPRYMPWEDQPQQRPIVSAPVLALVSGRVLHERGSPVAGAVVSLTTSAIASSLPESRMTANDGSYHFADFPGEYFISARMGS